MSNQNDATGEESRPETIEELRASFNYGSRSNLDMKFVSKLSDDQFGDFLSEILLAVGDAVDHADPTSVIDAAYRWQVEAYRGPNDRDESLFPFNYEDTPWAQLKWPLSEARVALMTSSGHFVDGDDPEPFGVKNMGQAEAEARIKESLKEAPILSRIPRSTDFANLRVRHGGYPVRAAKADPQVVFPLRILETLEAEGVIGELASEVYSFPGATAQPRLKKETGPAWAEMLKDLEIDAVLLVPI